MKLHTFPDTGTAYDMTQCDETITNGDILVINSEKVIGVSDTWPFAVTVTTGKLHGLNEGAEVDDELKKKFGPHLVRAMGQAILRGWPVRPEFLALLPKAQKHMRCPCCGGYTTGRQWHNRDDGYALCNNCIDDCVTNPEDWLEAGCSYGVPGIHYDLTGEHWRAKNGVPA